MARTVGRFELLEKLPGATEDEATFTARKGPQGEVVELRVQRACSLATNCASGCGPTPRGPRPTKVVHPNLERAREYDAQPGVLLTVSDHRETRSLPDYLAAHAALEADVALDLLLPVGEALADVHEAGLVHGGVAASRVQVEEGSERAYLPLVPACASLGLYEDPECRPSDHPACPAVSRGEGSPRRADDVAGYIEILQGAVEGPEASVVVDALDEVDPETATMPEVLERMSLLRTLIQEHRDRRRGRVSMMNMKLRRRKKVSRACEAPQELVEGPFWARVNRAFEGTSSTGRAALFLVMAAASFPVPMVDQVMAHPTQPAPKVVRAKPRPAAKPKAPTKPKGPQLAPPVAALVQVADAAWKAPTDEQTFAPRFKVVWSFVKSQPPAVRAELGGKEALLDVRKLAARDGSAGHSTLDRLIARCREQVATDLRRAEELAKAKASAAGKAEVPSPPKSPAGAPRSPGRS